VAPTASADEIRAAYRALARRLHPDKQGGAQNPEMAAVNEAWRVLSDPARRAVYDGQRRPAASGAVSENCPPDDDFGEGDDDDDDLDAELSPAEVRASRNWALIFGFTAVVVTLLLLALFAYAFTRSPVVTNPGGPQP
jgi:molecular chaperone DnaJ